MFKYIRFPLLLLIAFSSCKDDPEPQLLSLESEFENKTLQKLSALDSESSRLWSGFDLMRTYPIYLVFTDSDGNSTNGYIMNPTDQWPTGSESLEKYNTFGIDMIKNNLHITTALQDFGEFRSFGSQYVEGVDYFVIRRRITTNPYDIYKDYDDNWLPLALLHEIFHIYQLEIDLWELSGWFSESYDLDVELIKYHLLLLEITNMAYSATETDYSEYLGMYQSIWEEMIKLDTSGHLEGKTYAELIEGSARYLEHFSAYNTIYPTINEDPSHSWRGQLESSDNPDRIVYILTGRLWYQSGAIVTHMLKELGVDIESAYKAGITPLETTRSVLELTPEELDQKLNKAKSLVNWSELEDRAANYNDLIN